MSLDDNFLATFSIEEDDDVDERNRRKPSKQEKRELLDFIGGFRGWPQLDKDCKLHIVHFLDYWSRCSLSLCSREHYQLVREAVLVRNETMRMRPANLSRMMDEAAVEHIFMRKNYLQVTSAPNIVRSWTFTKKDENCRIVSKSSMNNTFTFSNTLTVADSEPRVEYAKTLKKWLERGKETLASLEVHQSCWPLFSHLELSIQFDALKSAKLEYRHRAEIDFWMAKMASVDRLDDFRIALFDSWPCLSPKPIPFESIDIRCVTAAKTLRLLGRVDITDEQFLRIRARRIILTAITLSPQVLMELVRRWVDDELEADFSQCFIRMTNPNFRSQFLDELAHQNFTFTRLTYQEQRSRANWHEFYSKFHRLVGFAPIFQIEQRANRFNVLSVFCNSDHFLMVRTGFESAHGNVELRFPDDFISY